MNRILIISLCCFFIVSCNEYNSQSNLVDSEQIFNSNENIELNRLLDSINKLRNHRIVVHTVAQDNSNRTFKMIADSIFESFLHEEPVYLISVSKSLRNVSFTFDENETGSEQITYEKTDSIIVNYMLPSLKNGDYKKACFDGVISLNNSINGR